MAEDLQIASEASREERYSVLSPQLEALLDGEANRVANLANFTAALKETFGFLSQILQNSLMRIDILLHSFHILH